MRLSSTSLVSIAALSAGLAGGGAVAQPATLATPATGQPGAPTVQSTAPLPGQPAADTMPAASDGNAGASGDFLNTIVVTGSRQGRTKMQSSTSVTDITGPQITQFTPRSEADILHLIPGIRVESTAGPGGNSNITVRGLPLASGGSKYVQLQENGIADVEFGDIAFGNNDYWQRYDYTVDHIQTVRGGTASTGASQAPGAVINYISKTGETAGGKIGITTGFGYDDTRLDFDYGAPIDDTLRFNVGGFVRKGDGPRSLSYNAAGGYQIKGNVTKTFDGGNGYVRLNVKRLDDREPSYTSSPFGVKLKGDEIVGYYKLPGFDARKDTSFSRYDQSYPIVEPNGTVKTGTNRDGINVRSSTIGGDFHEEFGTHFSVDDHGAYTWNRGTFAVPFYGSLTNVAALTGGASPYTVTAGGTTYTATQARAANGPNAGQVLAGSTVINANPTLNTTMNNMDHWANDLGLTGKFDFGPGKLTARAAYYHYHQNIDMDWHWNAGYKTADGHDPVLVDLYSANGTKLTDNGLTGYNNAWGGFDRHYDLHYSGDAPYGTLNYDDDHIDLDGSVRYDRLHAGGSFFQTAGTPTSLDVNGDGVLSVAEQNVYLNSGTGQKIDYTVHYTSWSAGANYRFDKNTAVFVRASQGYRANADRLVGNGPGYFNADGSLAAGGKATAVNPVTQQEAGIKQRGNIDGLSYGLFLTGFRSQATEYNIDIDARGITQLNQRYHTYGAELESQLSYGPVVLNGNLVYTHSRIVQDSIGDNAGNVPRATPDLMWTISPSISFPLGSAGVTVIGQTSTYPDESNLIKQKGVTTLNAFVSVHPVPKLTVSVNAANLFDTFDQAGRLDQTTTGQLASTGSLFGVPYAATNRVAVGRTVSGSISFDF